MAIGSSSADGAGGPDAYRDCVLNINKPVLKHSRYFNDLRIVTGIKGVFLFLIVEWNTTDLIKSFFVCFEYPYDQGKKKQYKHYQ